MSGWEQGVGSNSACVGSGKSGLWGLDAVGGRSGGRGWVCRFGAGGRACRCRACRLLCMVLGAVDCLVRRKIEELGGGDAGGMGWARWWIPGGRTGWVGRVRRGWGLRLWVCRLVLRYWSGEGLRLGR